MTRNSESPPRPSPVACLACRRRHVKCDAAVPACTRCQATFTECQYVRSKRGLRKHARESSPETLNEENPSFSLQAVPDWLDPVGFSSDVNIDVLPSATPELPHNQSTDGDSRTTKTPFQPFDPPIYDFSHAEDTLVSLPDPDLVTPEVAFDPMIQLYYHNFHPSHPMVIPRKTLNSPLCYIVPQSLLSIMRYIGAHYYHNPSLRQEYRQSAFSALSDPKMHDGFKVQALLLLVIIEHSHGNEKHAHRLIQRAINLALEIGLNCASFAAENFYGHAVLEESWRRTYWELYIVDGLLAAMRQQHGSFRLYHQPVNLQLPCAESTYNCDSVIGTGQTLQDLQNDWTLGQNFSTFAYRISAVQQLGAVLELNRSLENHLDSHIETIDAHLTSSLIALPPLHSDGHDSSSHDEMAFQAQMALYLAMIYLHHPRSNMRFASFQITPPTSCTNTNTNTSLQIKDETESRSLSQSQPPLLDLPSHKLLRAADLLSGLATLPSSIQRRSPFFTCALAMCIVVHTAALLVVSGSAAGKEESLKARIQLGIGGLKALGKVWPLSESVRRQMVEMYHGVVGK
ncbi:uncharacterized protein BDV17DRAFT_18003 [Aspergillus undulatus]|uniref:uncharacterized protein n=1 Tax=Aspergillus undulatus TaxID=1810928 RepID=UPI003CCDC88E